MNCASCHGEKLEGLEAEAVKDTESHYQKIDTQKGSYACSLSAKTKG